MTFLQTLLMGSSIIIFQYHLLSHIEHPDSTRENMDRKAGRKNAFLIAMNSLTVVNKALLNIL